MYGGEGGSDMDGEEGKGRRIVEVRGGGVRGG